MSDADQFILALNCGSSSLKFGVYRAGAGNAVLVCEGEAEEIGRENVSFWLKQDGRKETEKHAIPDHGAAVRFALEQLERRAIQNFSAVGHRVVHGGPNLREHQVLTPEVVEQLRAAVPFAPLHVPASLLAIEAIGQNSKQVICLDTAFHLRMPDVSKTLALPANARALNVERYGFHGISLESILAQVNPVPERLVVAHLGNGSSITAIRNGQSIDTSMGLTPTGGVMMGTRCGDLDPGVLLYLMRNGFASVEKLDDLVNHQSGLLGVSENTSDVRELLEVRRRDTRADLALCMFCYQVRKAIAAMAAALGGLDVLVFTGGIGEHAADLRSEICSQLAFLGKFAIEVLPSEEDLQIARITAKMIAE